MHLSGKIRLGEMSLTFYIRENHAEVMELVSFLHVSINRMSQLRFV